MMTIEQFRNAEFAAMYSERYLERLVRYHAGLFRALIKSGTLIGEDPDTLALEYVAPVVLMVEICDRQPEREAECLKRLEAHVRNFYRTYSPHMVKKAEKEAVIVGIIATPIAKTQAAREVWFYVMSGGITLKILTVEIARIIATLR
ncbi:MAG: hypothetical protein ACLTZI_15630 [[Eubacterium] siraeum]